MNLDNDYALKSESPNEMNLFQREAMVKDFGHYLAHTDSLFAKKQTDHSLDNP